MNRIIYVIVLFLLLTCHTPVSKSQNGLEDILPTEIIIEGNKADKDLLLQKVFKHSLILEKDYPYEKLSIFNDIDTTIVAEKISDTRIELPCRNTPVILENLPEDEYGYYSNYTYIGKLDAINVYMVYGEYAETSGYQLIDRESGEVILYCNLLLSSPDGRYIISGDYEGVNIDYFDLIIYRVENKKLRQIATLNYYDWVYTGSTTKSPLWGSDGIIYIPFAKFPDTDNKKYLKLDIDLDKLQNLNK